MPNDVDAEMNGVKDGEYDYDLFVIGAGSGGVRASRMSASFGAKVSKQHFSTHLQFASA